MKNRIFVTGIGTGVGKTICAAAICKTFGHSYWKPVQCGDLDQSDAIIVKKLSPETLIHPESYLLRTPQSPHLAAKIENISISLGKQDLPADSKICVEGAGGIMVPLNDEHTFMDFLIDSQLYPVIVIRHYLGSINHSLLTLQGLVQAGMEEYTILWNGVPNSSSEEAILKRFTPSAQYRMEEWTDPSSALPRIQKIS